MHGHARACRQMYMATGIRRSKQVDVKSLPRHRHENPYQVLFSFSFSLSYTKTKCQNDKNGKGQKTNREQKKQKGKTKRKSRKKKRKKGKNTNDGSPCPAVPNRAQPFLQPPPAHWLFHFPFHTPELQNTLSFSLMPLEQRLVHGPGLSLAWASLENAARSRPTHTLCAV